MTKLFAILAGALAFASTAQAAASTQDITVEGASVARVPYADLNLNSAAGRQQLQKRIESAASNLCVESVVQPVAVKMDQARCYRRAVSSGDVQMTQLALLP
jgi:UrcA family protein